MQNRDKMPFLGFVVAHKRTAISVAVLVVVVVCAIAIPLICANKWCFQFSYVPENQELKLNYIGTSDLHFYLLFYLDGSSHWRTESYNWDPLKEDRSLNINFKDRPIPESSYAMISVSTKNHGDHNVLKLSWDKDYNLIAEWCN